MYNMPTFIDIFILQIHESYWQTFVVKTINNDSLLISIKNDSKAIVIYNSKGP